MLGHPKRIAVNSVAIFVFLEHLASVSLARIFLDFVNLFQTKKISESIQIKYLPLVNDKFLEVI